MDRPRSKDRDRAVSARFAGEGSLRITDDAGHPPPCHQRSMADPPRGDDPATDNLRELLEETRILLPGTELLIAFLVSLPFTERFSALSSTASRLLG